MSKTRVFRRRADLFGDGEPLNDATQVVDGAPWVVPARPFDARALFLSHFDEIRRAHALHPDLGLLILAFEPGLGVVGEAWLKGSLDQARAAIVGRHSLCDLLLPPAHPTISLRHLAVLMRASSHDDVRVQVIDLHTQVGFTDEAGRTLHAAVAEGPAFLRVGTITLLFLVTHHADRLPDDPEAAYRVLPPRVFAEERLGAAGHAAGFVKRPPRGLDVGVTMVRSRLGPIAAAGELINAEEPPVGTLILRGGGRAVKRPVGESALERGLLIGRYARCDIGTADEGALSRVHLLVIRDGDDLVAVDTSSTNGTKVGEREIRIAPLVDGTVLNLADELEVVWHSVS